MSDRIRVRRVRTVGEGGLAIAEPGEPADLEGIRRRIAAANAAYVEEMAEVDLPPEPRLALAVVACVDCRLAGRLEDALGLRPGDAVMIRVAGNTFGGTDDLTRSLAVAVFTQGVRSILVVGHTDCGLTRIDPMEFRDRLYARGVSTFAMGGFMTREWLGVFSDADENVRDTVRRLRAAPILPKDVQVAGAVIDTRTGALSWVDL